MGVGAGQLWWGRVGWGWGDAKHAPLTPPPFRLLRAFFWPVGCVALRQQQHTCCNVHRFLGCISRCGGTAAVAAATAAAAAPAVRVQVVSRRQGVWHPGRPAQPHFPDTHAPHTHALYNHAGAGGIETGPV